MLRAARTFLFILIAFWVGIVYERNTQADKCLDRGGRIVESVCYGDS